MKMDSNNTENIATPPSNETNSEEPSSEQALSTVNTLPSEHLNIDINNILNDPMPPLSVEIPTILDIHNLPSLADISRQQNRREINSYLFSDSDTSDSEQSNTKQTKNQIKPSESYMQLIVKDFIKSLEKKNNIRINEFMRDLNCKINLESHCRNFKIINLNIKRKRVTNLSSYFHAQFSYSFRYLPDVKFHHLFSLDFRSYSSIFGKILELLWTGTICKECLGICNTKKCDSCNISKNYWDYGIAKGYIEYIPVCTICFDSVYTSRYECGHYFHRSCILQYNYNQPEESLNCPNCRKKLTKDDKINFYIE